MEGYIVHGGMGMARGSLARIFDGRGLAIEVWDGELWITQERDQRDYFIGPGGRFRLERNGLALAYALRPSLVTLTASVPAYYARRITLRLPGAAAERLVYDRARETGGWLAGVGHGLARFCANAYAARSGIGAVLCFALAVSACDATPVAPAFAASPGPVSTWPSPVGEGGRQVFEYH